jgi:hypothetical protein
MKQEFALKYVFSSKIYLFLLFTVFVMLSSLVGAAPVGFTTPPQVVNPGSWDERLEGSFSSVDGLLLTENFLGKIKDGFERCKNGFTQGAGGTTAIGLGKGWLDGVSDAQKAREYQAEVDRITKLNEQVKAKQPPLQKLWGKFTNRPLIGEPLPKSPNVRPTSGNALLLFAGAVFTAGQTVCVNNFTDAIRKAEDAVAKVKACAEQGYGTKISGFKYINREILYDIRPIGLWLPQLIVVCDSSLPGPLYSKLYARGPIALSDSIGTLFYNKTSTSYEYGCFTLDHLRSNGYADYFIPTGSASINLDFPNKTYSIGWVGNGRFDRSATGKFTYSPTITFLLPSDTVKVTLKPSELNFSGYVGPVRESFPGGTVTLSKFRPDGSGYAGRGTMLVTGINWAFRSQALPQGCDNTQTIKGSIDGIR